MALKHVRLLLGNFIERLSETLDVFVFDLEAITRGLSKEFAD